MKIYLMRHGDASPVGGEIEDDAQRPLSAFGQKQVRAVAGAFRAQGLVLAHVWSSPLIRARETAQIMAELTPERTAQPAKALAPQASPAGLQKMLEAPLKAQAAGILFVGHHPDVTLWVSFLTGIDAAACPVFNTASVAALELEPPKRKPRLLWFHTAEQIVYP